MKTIYKYPLEAVDAQRVTLPANSKLLCIKLQNGTPCLWALVDPNETYSEGIDIRCAGTGHNIEEENLEYIDTVLMYNDRLVFHFFKIIYNNHE